MNQHPKVTVGIVVWRGDEVLLIKRGKPPFQGQWSIPGGSVEWGERLEEAALRELMEETGVKAKIAGLIDVFQSISENFHYVMVDFAAHWTEGEPQAGDDALEASFFSKPQALARVAWDDTRKVIEQSRVVLDRHDLAPSTAQNVSS